MINRLFSQTGFPATAPSRRHAVEATCRIQTSVIVVLLTLGLTIGRFLIPNAVVDVRRLDMTKACRTG